VDIILINLVTQAILLWGPITAGSASQAFPTETFKETATSKTHVKKLVKNRNIIIYATAENEVYVVRQSFFVYHS
jgi:hypothetical protein